MYMQWEPEVPGREAEGKIAKDAVRSLLELEWEAGEVCQLHGTNKYPCSSKLYQIKNIFTMYV